MYKKDKAQRGALFLGGGLAFGICLFLIVFFIWILVLRTEYRAACLEINDTILATDIADITVQRDGKTWPTTVKLVDYYNMGLLADGVQVFNRANLPLSEKSIILHIGENDLSFTGYDNGTAINIHWATPRGLKTYTVRCNSTSFMQYTAYLSNYVRDVDEISG